MKKRDRKWIKRLVRREVRRYLQGPPGPPGPQAYTPLTVDEKVSKIAQGRLPEVGDPRHP